METRRIAALIFSVVSLSSLTSQHKNKAQECRVYQLVGHSSRHETPSIHIDNLLTVSFYNPVDGHFPNNSLINLRGSSRNGSIYINPEGKVILRLNESSRNRTLTFEPTRLNHSWVTLAILLQDNNIAVYRTDEREKVIAATSPLGAEVYATVSTSGTIYVALNCPAGCLVHDNTSPLIGRELPLEGDGATIYLTHNEGTPNANLHLGFNDDSRKPITMQLNVSHWEPSLWHKVTIIHDKEKNVIVKTEKDVGTALRSEEELTFAILNSTSVLWSLYCYPDNATGLKGWNVDVPDETPITPEESKGGAGIGEVLAWVLAGMALFIVMIMALLLCTKMGPREDTLGYGASVGVVTSFGRSMVQRDAVREAEEDTEPDSPTLMAPVISINHMTPNEAEEDQVNTKML